MSPIQESLCHQIEGKWVKVAESGIAELYKALGSTLRSEPDLTLTWEFCATRNRWLQLKKTADLEYVLAFQTGKPFQHVAYDGIRVKSIISIEVDPNDPTITVLKHIQSPENGKALHMIREFTGNHMRTKFMMDGKADGVTASYQFERAC